MAPNFDASTQSAAGTGTLSFTHTPVGTPRGVLVLIAQSPTNTDQVSGVTYGGVAMTEVALSPLQQTAGAEHAIAYGYFLGSGIPTGAQTVVVSVTGAESKRAVCYTVTATGDVEVEDTSTLNSGGAASPSVTLTTGVGVETFCAGVLVSALNDPSFTKGADYTSSGTNDFGTSSAGWERRTTNATGGNVTLDWTNNLGNEAGILGVALKQSASVSTTKLAMVV